MAQATTEKAIDRERVAELLAIAQATQTAFWDALTELEQECDAQNDELDGLMTADLEQYDVDAVLALLEDSDGDDMCDRCGRSDASVSRTDENGTVCDECAAKEGL